VTKLPVVSARELVAAMRRLGYEVRRQTGSHVHLKHDWRPRLTIPNRKEIARGTLKAIITQAGISVEELTTLLK
jgi:predicted RNA binding protein YcfA (HicA-like mRNA interferase family)